MTHWIIAPVVLPALLAPFIVLAARYHIGIQRVFSVAGVLSLIAIAAGLAWQASDGTIILYQLSDWAAPFGIVLVGDRLSTLMILLTAVLALFVILYAIGSGWDKRGWHFHALFQFQLMGIMGAFLTGDVFNLFVFFEVLLIASYGLMIHGGGNLRLRAGVQYVLFNLLGSTLFLFALGAIYAETGTLNMADLAQRVALIDPAESVGIRIASVMLLLVFAIKAAVVPLHFWLPSSYAEAPAPVAALFAIMTKVGAYAIIRVYTMVFAPDLDVTAGLHGLWLLPAALVSLALGMIGVLAARKLDRLVAFAVIGSMGMVMISISLFSQAGIAAALYYIVHSTLAAAALFLICDLVRAGRAHLNLTAAPPVSGAALTAALFFVAAIAMTGLPPLSGFVGKLMILDAAFDTPLAVWTWAIILSASLISVVGFARAGSVLFWKANAETLPEHEGQLPAPRPSVLSFSAVGGLLALLILHTVFAGPAYRYADATAKQLFDPAPYISKVLGTPGKLSTPKEGH
ncbi:monovalent cation/H+ antiporter subunit D [Sulfitobacter mediterraneus]|uniref:monovalent cation/H+ antiporter subunit D n=1 Tax=Sulfitobacter mediterraneus TaxID=83219 RepID=UPI00193A2B04|nr:monovalent cation/H+ antiporter subunit D [Sulfitobacter mediterraneus]MBM1555940.1 monovalent cation/H+ antiporter subunit D [Sulfitobacter mediterraneus]MBM1568022.1 monovalent cation/H+ antiporter subunit D [Sulfitobacter mediterraneus]MBM1571294.1 monovalent cation/H+ antiporter subunit D [Sulfitobacter mediterraneus]MBM1575082.1 monovalent cation/H+ antiporter subunit D [Sulfitobacter mediterraneus]MBM1579427.1 monovalent cation/H+ antiporter subunit D [Sulfitobacter mediterraneus]